MSLLETLTYPTIGAHFAVYFHGILPNPIDMAFQSVTGLSASIETEDIVSGGINSQSLFLPKKVSYSNLVLKRGLKAIPSPLAKWCEDAFGNFIFQPVDVVISLLNEKHLPLHTWYINGAIPIKYEFGEMNAENSAIFIETFELKYKSFKILQ